jgi:hypothetical protein
VCLDGRAHGGGTIWRLGVGGGGINDRPSKDYVDLCPEDDSAFRLR